MSYGLNTYKHTGFRNISTELDEGKIQISSTTPITSFFKTFGPGDPLSIFAEEPVGSGVARVVNHGSNSFNLTYIFTNEGKRPLNKLTFQFGAGFIENIKISLTTDGENFDTIIEGDGTTTALSNDSLNNNGTNSGTMDNNKDITVIFSNLSNTPRS